MESKLFRKYTGTKTVKAMPMSAYEAKENGAQLTEMTLQRNLGVDGYLVEYPYGYRSWCPKKEFEDCYKVSESFIDRMNIELQDLTEKICKGTRAYLCSKLISNADRVVLGEQLKAMNVYAKILRMRIEKAESQGEEREPCYTVDPKESYGKV